MKAKRCFSRLAGDTKSWSCRASLLLISLLAMPVAQANQAQTWAITWFTPAMASTAEDCPSGENPRWARQRIKNLRTMGYTERQIKSMEKEELAGEAGYEASAIVDANRNRARIDGQPANAYMYPANVPDPMLKPATHGKFAYGFNMDGRGELTVAGFEDPLSHEKGVNNQFARALGCMPEFRGTLEHPANNWVWLWAQLRTQRPVWLVSLIGENLNQDGPVTVLIERAVEALVVNADSSPRRDVTYRVNPSPRSVNRFSGVIRDGVVTLEHPGTQGMYLLYDTAIIPEFRMRRIHLRMVKNSKGELEGFISGYEPWTDIYYGLSSGGKNNEDANTGDLAGIYYLLKKHADADPDPSTKQNAAISITYNFTSVPALRISPRPERQQTPTAH